MPTLDTVTNYNTNLTIKYHSSRVPSAQQCKTLADCLELAKKAVEKTVSQLDTFISQKKMDPLSRSIFKHHFRFGDLTTDSLPETWIDDLKKVRRVYAAVKQGLNQPITISDAYSTELKAQQANFAVNLLSNQLTAANHPFFNDDVVYVRTTGTLPGGLAANTPYHVIDAHVNWFRLATSQGGAAVVVANAGIGTHTAYEIKQTPRGYVKPKKNQIKDPNTNKWTANQLGSIHINFQMLVNSTKSPKITVARTIIHEATHKFKDTEDFAYAWYHPAEGIAPAAAYNSMTKGQAMDNADSFAYTAICLYKRQLYTKMVDSLYS
jgi:hypothetical protein